MKTAKEIAADCGIDAGFLEDCLQHESPDRGAMTSTKLENELCELVGALYRRIETLENSKPKWWTTRIAPSVNGGWLLIAITLKGWTECEHLPESVIAVANRLFVRENLDKGWFTHWMEAPLTPGGRDRKGERPGEQPHKFEVHEGEDPLKPGIWCKHCNTTEDEVPGLHVSDTKEVWKERIDMNRRLGLCVGALDGLRLQVPPEVRAKIDDVLAEAKKGWEIKSDPAP